MGGDHDNGVFKKPKVLNKSNNNIDKDKDNKNVYVNQINNDDQSNFNSSNSDNSEGNKDNSIDFVPSLKRKHVIGLISPSKPKKNKITIHSDEDEDDNDDHDVKLSPSSQQNQQLISFSTQTKENTTTSFDFEQNKDKVVDDNTHDVNHDNNGNNVNNINNNVLFNYDILTVDERTEIELRKQRWQMCTIDEWKNDGYEIIEELTSLIERVKDEMR